MTGTIRVVLPYHLQVLAGCGAQVQLEVNKPVTQSAILDALEKNYPTLRGVIIDHSTGRRRPLIRFFACKEDLSHESPDKLLPDEVVSGKEPFLIVGAIAGG